jgi:hypothetical protein
MIPESKICNMCGIEKSNSEYGIRKHKTSVYLKPYCKKCCVQSKKIGREKARKQLPEKFCYVCNSVLSGMQKKFCSRKCKSKKQYNTVYGNQLKRGLKRKEELVDKFGGCCTICGYSKCLAALHFHHIDPTMKEFALDSRKLRGTTIESIEKEASKCILVCSNCHAEIHHPDHMRKERSS